MNKYHSKTVYISGEKFDSKKEANRYQELLFLEKAGEIHKLQRQVKFTLIPEQREKGRLLYKKGPKRGTLKPGKVIEKECSYIADFTYYDSNWDYVVEDTKGFQTKEFKIKKKLMLWIHGIRIKLT